MISVYYFPRKYDIFSLTFKQTQMYYIIFFLYDMPLHYLFWFLHYYIIMTKIVYQCLTIIVKLCLRNAVKLYLTRIDKLCLTNVVKLSLTRIVKLVKFIKHNFTHKPLGIWVLLMWVVPIQDNVSLNYNPLFQGKTFWFHSCQFCT